MSFEKSIIWQNDGTTNGYDKIGSSSKGEITNQQDVFLSRSRAIKSTLFSPVIPPVAVGLRKFLDPTKDVYFSEWRMIPQKPNEPISWISLLKMWESWRDKDNDRNNHYISIAVNEDLELMGRGVYEVPDKDIRYKTFDWWESDLDIEYDQWFRLMCHIRKHESSGSVEWFLNDEQIFFEDGIKTHFPETRIFYATSHTYYSSGETRERKVVTYTDESVAATEYIPLNYRVGEDISPKKTLAAEMLPFPILLNKLLVMRKTVFTEYQHRKLHPLI